jgi:glycosyltransferase involved in cell wall biosynthesis
VNRLSTSPTVSIVVLTYNWSAALARVLESIARQSRLPAEVIVADDGSSDGTAELVRQMASRFPVPLRHVWQEDLGFRAARARNRGIATCRGEYIVLIDGDMVLHPRFLADHLRFAERGYYLQGGRLCVSMDETNRLIEGGAARFHPWINADFKRMGGSKRLYAFRSRWLSVFKARARRGGRVMSCNMSFWKEDLVAVNGFDERMEGYGSEDLDLAARLDNLGRRRRQLKFAALALHLEHTSRAPIDPDDMAMPNNQLLAQTRSLGIVRARIGLDSHLGAIPIIGSSSPANDVDDELIGLAGVG